MENEEARVNGVCRRCGYRDDLAAADASALGLLDEFLEGTYSCCQVAQWADEQWIAWQDAGREDGKGDKVTGPLEVEPDAQLVFVRARRPKLGADPKP